MSEELTVEQSFQKLIANLNPTEKQQLDIRTKRETIDSALANDQRIFLHTEKQQSFLTGSYARDTIIRPINDVDLYVRVNYGEHAKDKSPRSILLLMASALRKRYPNNTQVNVDSPCVVVTFWGFKFEIAPVVCYEGNADLYDIPAPGSQSWIQCYPNVPSKWLSYCNYKNDEMFIPLIKILKQWNRNNKVGLKSFHLELLTEKVFGSVTEIYSYPQGIFDWMFCVRNWLRENKYPFIEEPGHGNKYVDDYLYGNAFRLMAVRSKVDAGLKSAERAYDFFGKGRQIVAKRIWKSMFGSMFPSPEPEPSKPVLIPPKQQPALTLRDVAALRQPTGLLGGIQPNATRNALLNILSGQSPAVTLRDVATSRQPTGLLGDFGRKALIDALANPSPTPPKNILSEIDRDILANFLSNYSDPFRKK